MDPVHQRHALEILDAALQLSERWSIGHEFLTLNRDPTPPVGVAVGQDPSELLSPIRVRHLTGSGSGRFEHLLKGEEFAILWIRLQRFRHLGTSLGDTITLNQRANSGGVVAGGVHRLTLAVLLHGHRKLA